MRNYLLPVFLLFSANLLAQAPSQQVNLFNIPNQSSHFVRMPARESSTEIDAVYTNPAGVTKLKNGFHLSVNNQFVRQKINLTSDYQYLNEMPGEYEGYVRAYFFPGVFIAWKKDRLALTAAAVLAGGGGGATFTNLPSADMGIADVPPVLKQSLLDGLNNALTASAGYNPGYNEITGYRFDFSSYGVAYSPGYQIGAAYKVKEYLSVALAARYVSSTTNSQGYVKNIEINVPQYGGYQLPGDYLHFVSEQPELNATQSIIVSTAANLYDELASDRVVDVVQKGQGITPIIGIHSTPIEKLDVGIKYEHRTVIILRTTVRNGNDGGGQYTDGEAVRSDFPGYISAGVKYQFTKRILAAVGSRYFFSKMVDYGGREAEINKNYFEVTSGVEYLLTEKARISGGYTYNHPNVTKNYQSEVDFQIPGHTVALGGAYNINELITCNAGILFTQFVKETNAYQHLFANGVIESDFIPYNRVHAKNALIFSVGVDFAFLQN